MRAKCLKFYTAGVSLVLSLSVGLRVSAEDAPSSRKLGYVLSEIHWALYQTPDAKAECPDGFNEGPREQFKALLAGTSNNSVLETQQKYEIAQWFPEAFPIDRPFREATGRISYGLNLDDKNGPNDFISPDGEPGIDNQFYRVLGCIAGFRGPDGFYYFFPNKYFRDHHYNRLLLELSGVDSLSQDDDVDVALFRGVNKLQTDATGENIAPGGTQLVDERWGKRFERRLKGKIVDGVLITDPIDAVIPWMQWVGGAPWEQPIRGMRLRLAISESAATGTMAGYNEIDAWYFNLNKAYTTVHHGMGQLAAPSLYRALKRLADGYPDPTSGENTAISSALNVKFTQVFIRHREREVAVGEPPGSSALSGSAQ